MNIKKNLSLKDNQTTDSQANSQRNVFCRLHNQQCDLICLADGKNICYNCVIFGQHKGHQVQTSQKFYQKLYQFQESLLTIASNIKSVKSKQKKKLELHQYLKKQQNAKINKIKQAFHGLIVQLKIKQKQCIRKIQKQYNQIENKMNKKDQKLRKSLQKNQQHEDWFSSFSELIQKQYKGNVLPHFQDNRMFLTDQKRSDFLLIGRRIEQQCKILFQNLQQQIKTLASTIQIKLSSPSCKSIFIQNWCQIQHKQVKMSRDDKSEYSQQDSQFYLLSSVRSVQDLEQCQTALIQQKQNCEEELLLNSIRADDMQNQSETISKEPNPIKNVDFAVLKQVDCSNTNNINTKKVQELKVNMKNFKTNKVSELKRKLIQKKLVR